MSDFACRVILISGCSFSAMDGGDSGGGDFSWSGSGGPDVPGPGAPYGWFILIGVFVAVMAVFGAIATHHPLVLVFGAVGLVFVAIGLYERHKGTRAWDRD